MRGLRALLLGLAVGLIAVVARPGDPLPLVGAGAILALAVVAGREPFGVVEAAIARASATLPLLITMVYSRGLSFAMYDAIVIATAFVTLGVYGLIRHWAGGVLAIALGAAAAFVAFGMEIACAISPGWLAPHACVGPREHLDAVTWTALALAISLTIAIVPLGGRVRRALA